MLMSLLVVRNRRRYRLVLDLRKDFIIFYIVIMTNVFSCDGVDS